MPPKDRILELLMIAGEKGVSSAKIGQICKLGSWRLYYHLIQLEQKGTIEGRFEGDTYPRKRVYYVAGLEE